MIARIEGLIDSVDQGSAMLRTHGQGQTGLTYQVLLPAFVESRLHGEVGNHIQLHTFHFLESQGQGSTMLPRLAGFLTTNDLGFYQEIGRASCRERV